MSSVLEWLAPAAISSGVAGGVALATHYSSVRAKRLETREDIRTEAFDQAKSFYTDVIDRQEKELAEMRQEIAHALTRVKAAEESADQSRAAVRALRVELAERDDIISDLRAHIARQ